MGWFLTKNKGKKKRKPAKAKRDPLAAAPWDPKRTLRGLAILGGVLGVAGVAAGWRYGEQALHDYAARVAGTQRPITQDTVELVTPPDWLADPVQREIEATVLNHLTTDPMDGQSLQHAAWALVQKPWVRKVYNVERQRDGRVEIVAEYRKPYARVRLEDGDYIVDDRGYVLFGTNYPLWIGKVDLPVITGIDDPPPRTLGERWRGHRLLAGIELVRALEGEPYADQILAYNVGYKDPTLRRTTAFLHTRDGGVGWGLLPGEDQPMDVSIEEKRKRLRRILRDPRSNGRIDFNGRIVFIYGPAIRIHDTTLMDTADFRATYTAGG